ncbi:MAG: elongation factor P maturation arginine rhamnosyltransferase EarP [Burkholderiaceae bacterium]|nr:elongation factor P maturation arginine rhamnosyltransferase EarP [Burkholderiaceae bacterium]
MTLAARILCRVVDNFGDAGVCWRFARQLAREHGWHVRLTIDRPELLARLGARPGIDAGRGAIAVEHWSADDSIARGDEDVLVSAFGAEPPPALRASLAGAPRRPLWVQLEYLSAEEWVVSHHGLRSTKPADGAVEHFYYPGFDARTGGLLREAGLFDRRDAFVGSQQQRTWLSARGIVAEPGERLATLFCYPQAPIAAWFRLLAAGPTRWRVLVPEGVADAALSAYFGRSPTVGQALRESNLAVQRVPFLPQDEYDQLLWSVDLNVVRGEDSWVRAQWATRPFLWQPYPQEVDTHLRKLRAFLHRLHGGSDVDEAMLACDEAMLACDEAMLAWSGHADWARAWPAFDAHLDELRPRFARWSATLGRQDDLCTRFVEFCIERL